MKVKLNQLKPNPFKKFIENGKLNEDRISILEESIEHGTLPESFFARKKEGTLELTSGHHRIEALKRKKGQHYEVEVTLLNYTDEQMLVDMVRENITQRNTEFHDTKDSIVLARAWLQSGVNGVKQFNTAMKQTRKDNGTFQPVEDSYRSIAKFLSKNGKAVSYVTIKNYLDINDKLNPKLLARVGKVKAGVNGNLGKEIPMKDALNLVRIENQEEQEEVAEALFKAEKNGIDRHKLMTNYKAAPDDIKAKVRNGEIDIADVRIKTLEKDLDINPELYRQTAVEWINEVDDLCEQLGKKLEIEKDKISSLSPAQAKLFYAYLQTTMEHYFVPFMEEVMKQFNEVEVIENDENK